MINKDMITKVNGCVSTGKEANVYHAFTPEGDEYAIKIYKTSILIFKDREKYIEGERRFRRGPSRSNPRNLIKLWAEKEFRNLKRIASSEIPCPEPIQVKTNILVMKFLGKDMHALPRLKDTRLIAKRYCPIYEKTLLYMRILY
jgi:RIO kinase 1